MNNQSDIRLLFSEIIRGNSIVYHQKNKLYLKHLTIIDSTQLDFEKDKFYTDALSRGLTSREEKEKFLIAEGLWSAEKNIEIENKKSLISNLKRTKSKLFKEVDIENIKKDIDQEEKKLKSLLFLKNQLTGFTAEDYSTKKANEYFIFSSLYKDENFKERYYSEYDYNELSDEDLNELIKIYNLKIDKFSSKNLKKVAVSSFYINLYNISNENASYLYGKPIVNLTYYQIDLFYNARYFKNMLSDTKNAPPNHLFEDPDKLIEWLESSKNVDDILNKNQSKPKKQPDFVASSIVGARDKDLEKMPKSENIINIHELAAKKGGKLSMEDLIKINN